MTTTIKRYPFSMMRYGHNIELAYNHQKIICCEMESGETPYKQEAFDHLEKLSDVYEKAIGSPVYWATGKEYEVLMEASVWAESYRDSRNGR